MNALDIIPFMTLVPFGITMLSGAAIVSLVMYFKKRHGTMLNLDPSEVARFNSDAGAPHVSFLARPSSWLAIRSRDLNAAQLALGLHNPKPCSWLEGLAGDQKLFLAPPINGWILIFGSVLPDVSDDVDATYHFLANLSRKVGHVQFFEANRILNHHAWVRMEVGRVVRAYAWAGCTLWNQGKPTRAELDLGMKCFCYFEAPCQLDALSCNTENVPALAAHWSLDPAGIGQHGFQRVFGIAGEPARLY